MKKSVVVETCREIPVVEDVDVAVIGGGTAGMPAAVAAARAGARTLLVERWGYVGGAAVGGLVVTVPERAGIWGIEREFYDELQQMAAISRANDDLIVSAPHCKYLGDQFLKRERISLLYHSWFAAVALDRGRIDGAIIENKSGRQAVRAKVFIDCTGDADVAFHAGVKCTKGDANGKMRDATTMYMLCHADLAKFEASGIRQGALPQRMSCFAPTGVNPGECNCWGGSVAGDGTDVRELTRMEIELREQIMTEAGNMRRFMPGFEKSFISIIAEQLGVRQTRTIAAEYTVTAADEAAEKVFEDSIGRAWRFTIPYRSLLPQGMDNLLVAGRCIGADHKIQDKMRIIPNCFTTGQAAGVAAAMAAAEGVPVREVDMGRLQAVLREQGVDLGK